MRATDIRSCYIGPVISPEQFIPEHFFLYISKGAIHGYDGSRSNTLKSGEYSLVRKNRLARYNKERENGEFEKVVIILDEQFLRKYQQKHHPVVVQFEATESFIGLNKSRLIPEFIASLMPYYTGAGKIAQDVADVKREELLNILLRQQPELSGLLFDYGIPEKIDLESFMVRNFRFNVSIQRFAYMTGRSISGFKRDFMTTFNDTPGHWLTTKRLQEAHFLLAKEHKKPSDIYLDLGFEDLSHFSFAFKKQFGITPTELKEHA